MDHLVIDYSAKLNSRSPASLILILEIASDISGTLSMPSLNETKLSLFYQKVVVFHRNIWFCFNVVTTWPAGLVSLDVCLREHPSLCSNTPWTHLVGRSEKEKKDTETHWILVLGRKPISHCTVPWPGVQCQVTGVQFPPREANQTRLRLLMFEHPEVIALKSPWQQVLFFCPTNTRRRQLWLIKSLP